MAVDATGAGTTNYAFPKFSTGADAPSGKGGNAQMDAVDTALKVVDNKVAAKPGIGIVIAMGG